MKPIISVIIPVYNSEKYLSDCIESVLNQSFKEFELILIDDGSNDNSPKICDKYEQLDKRIHVIHKKNEGVSAARNNGIINAKGEYITFVDSDDYIQSDFFEVAYSKVKKYDVEMYISGLIMETHGDTGIRADAKYCNKYSKLYDTNSLLNAWDIEYPRICISGPWCKLISRELIVNNQILFDVYMSRGEDTCFVFDILLHNPKIYFDDACFYHYRRANSESLFSGFCKEILNMYKKVSDKQRNLMQEFKCINIETLDKAYIVCLISCIHHYFAFKERNTFFERKSLIRNVANEVQIMKYKSSDVDNFGQKIMVFLLKNNFTNFVYFIFYLHYKNKERMV